MKACITHRDMPQGAQAAAVTENAPPPNAAAAAGSASLPIATISEQQQAVTYSRDQSILQLEWTGLYSELKLDIRIIMIENERREDDSGTSRPTQYKIEVRPLPMTLPRGQTTNPGQLGVTANKQLLKGIWHQFAMDVVHIAGLLDELPHDIAPVERYDFRFFLCPLEKAGEHYCCSKPRCISEHCQSVCRSNSMEGEGCEVFPRCNYIHAYSRLRVALSVAPTLLGPGLEADGLMISLVWDVLLEWNGMGEEIKGGVLLAARSHTCSATDTLFN